MYPTLKNGRVVLMKKYALELNYNDIVVIKKKNKIIIKRIVGLPYDNLFIDTYLYVNGKKFDESTIENSGTIGKTLKLNQNEYFVLGDNRKESIDSRFEDVGIINRDEIIGKLVVY